MTVYHSTRAIQKVCEIYGSAVTQEMLAIIEWEGYVDGLYTDTDGVQTKGVGQTGQFKFLPYPQVFELFKRRLLRYTPKLSSFPENVQEALLVSNYRGDWKQSPKTRRLFDAGRYQEASVEYLDNEDYREALSLYPHIARRFEYVAENIRSLVRV